MAGLVILKGDKLRTLATLIYSREYEVFATVNFQSGIEEMQHRNDSLKCKKTVNSLLDDGAKLVNKFTDDPTRGVIARDINDYIQYCCNSALQTVGNFTVRSNYLDKIKAHVDELIAELEGPPTFYRSASASASAVDPGTVAAIYKNEMLTLLKMFGSSQSSAFSQTLGDEQITFEQLLRRFQGELGFKIPFSDMIAEDKLRVYARILHTSGRGTGLTIGEVESGTFTKLSLAVFTFKVAYNVWDVFTSAHKIETAVRDAVSLAADIAGAAIGEIVQAALDTEILIGIEATDLFVSVIGFTVSFVASFIIGTIAGVLLDLFFSSGGTHMGSTDGHIFYVVELPDGIAEARKLVHN